MAPFSPRLGYISLLLALAACPECDDRLAQLTPVMEVTPGALRLIGIPVADDTPGILSLRNPSLVRLEDVQVSFAEGSDPALRVVEVPEAVEPESARDIRLAVRPRVVGTLRGTLIVTAEEAARPNRIEIPIEVDALDLGLPDIDVTPPVLDFARVGQGDVVRGEILVQNVGVRDLVIDQMTFEPAPDGLTPTPIRISLPLPPGAVLSPMEGLAAQLVFAPTDTASHRGDVVIRSNDPDEPEVRVNVQGQGSECPVAVGRLLDDATAIEPLDTVRFDASDSMAVTPDTTITSYAWQLEQRPIGSTAVIVGADQVSGELLCDLAGDYQVRLVVVDSDGVRSCTDSVLRFRAQPTQALHVQLVWDHPTADFDLHLVREGGQVFTHAGDVYFSNRTPNWYPANPDANPRLDVDDDSGYGPENINVVMPQAGARYTVYVHYWNKKTDGDAFANATVRIFAHGQEVASVSRSFDRDELLWRAAEITWPDDQLAPPEIGQLGTVEPYDRPF